VEDDEKVCPRCAETVKSAALVCRFCGYEFGTPVTTTPTAAVSTSQPVPTAVPQQHLTPPKKGHPFLVGCLIIIGIIIGLSVLGSLLPKTADSPSSDSSSSDVNETDAPSPTQVTAVELAQAYQANEVNAQNMYGDKTLDVTGTVTKVRLDLFNNPVVEMSGVNEFLNVQATFGKDYNNQLASVTIGQQITARCTSITSVISAPILSDCTLP
jgi:hypothetical protein